VYRPRGVKESFPPQITKCYSDFVGFEIYSGYRIKEEVIDYEILAISVSFKVFLPIF